MRPIQNILLIFFFFIPGLLTSQVVVHGTVKNAEGKHITGYILKVKQKGNEAFLYFNPIVAKEQFDIKLQNLKLNDTLQLILEAPDYQTVQKEVIINSLPFTVEMEIVLPPKGKELKEIVIKPAIWRSGDTTIYSVDHFKTGEERKLKDIITKLPGFSVDDDGKLKFKNKEVAKIFVEGVDLFADRVSLMLESFPVHVLGEVQAVENNPKNKLLAGISLDNETVVNLKLKKQKEVFWGDAEITGTTNKRYAVNPTVFSVGSKVKLGLVGFHSNTGTMLNPVLPILSTNSNPPGLQLNSYYHINNFNASRYLTNKIFNDQIVLNYPSFRNIKMKSEIAFGKETLNQFVLYEGSNLNDVVYIKRNDSIFNKYGNNRLKLGHEIEWIKAQKSRLFTRFSFQQNAINGSGMNYLSQGGYLDTVGNDGNSRGLLFSGEMQYTHRYDSLKAVNFSFTATYTNNNQHSKTLDNNIGLIFQQASQEYKYAKIYSENQVAEYQLLIDWIVKKGRKIRSRQLLITNGNLKLNNAFALAKTPGTESELNIPGFENTGSYSDYNIGYQSTLNIQRRKSITNVNWYGGFSYLKRNDHLFTTDSRFLPVAILKLSHIIKKVRKGNYILSADFSNKLLPLDQTPRGENPIQYNSFQQFRFTLRSLPALNMSIAYVKTSLSGKAYYAIFKIRRDFVSQVLTSEYNLFYNFSTKKFINTASHWYSFSTSNTFPLPFLRAVSEVHFNINISEQFRSNVSGSNITKSNFLFSAAGISLKFNNFKKFTIMAASSISSIGMLSSKSTTGGVSDKNSVNSKSSLNVRYFISQYSSAGMNINTYNFDLLNRKRHLLFSDLDYSWRIKNSKFEVQAKIENLFNQKNFILTQVTLLSQSSTEIPLIGRNIQLSVKMNF